MGRGGRQGGDKYYHLSGLSVMVADDNRFVRTLLVNVLHGLGIRRVLQAESGEEALAQLEASVTHQGTGMDVDILFCDHLMAPMDGVELLRAIRAHGEEKLLFLPVVMMSGDADERAVFLARDNGVTEYLAKPISVINVVTRLLAVIDRPRPFIRAPQYFGPDRRRQTLPYAGEERRLLSVDPTRFDNDDDDAMQPPPPPVSPPDDLDDL